MNDATKQETVLVTGASGCVGTFLVDELLKAGHKVIATDRPQAPAPPRRAGLSWKPADLTDPSSAPALVKGATAVIHTAALVDIAVPFESQAPINLFAVRYLYDAAVAEGVSYFLHFSTGSLYAPKDGPINEDDPLLPTSSYERTKLLAEDYLRTRTGGPIVNILRPALIYGPRGKVLLAPLATLPALLRRLDGWIPRIRGGPETNVVHGHDVARAAAHLLTVRPPTGSTFNVASDEVLPAGQLLATILEAAGIEPSRIALPFPQKAVKAVLPLLGFKAPFTAFNLLAGRAWQFLTRGAGLEGGLAPRLDMETTVYLGGNTIFDVSRLKSTGFAFRFPTFEKGWANTFGWYLKNRWVPGNGNGNGATAGSAPAAAAEVLEGATA